MQGFIEKPCMIVPPPEVVAKVMAPESGLFAQMNNFQDSFSKSVQRRDEGRAVQRFGEGQTAEVKLLDAELTALVPAGAVASYCQAPQDRLLIASDTVLAARHRMRRRAALRPSPTP